MSHAHQPSLFAPPDAANPERLRELRSFGAAEARREAHRRQNPSRKEKMWDRIVEFIRARGNATADEITAAWGCSPNSVAPRCCELLKLGRLRMTGAHRETRQGGRAAVLEVAPRGGSNE